MRRTLNLLVLLVTCAACAPAAPPPTPTPIPATPTPATTPVPTLDAASTDIQYAFLSNVNDLTSDVEALAMAQCSDLSDELRTNPTELTEMRGFASTFQNLGVTRPELNTSSDVRDSLDALTKALGQLDAALQTCGIRTP